ncbi:MAG TPA: hypothetical protein VF432_03590 [Thermoanaerobaculia bacterium]
MEASALSAHVRAFSPALYNRLPDVRDADVAFQTARDRDAFLGEIGDLICGHGLELYVGVSLLHKHNPVSDDQLMVEVFDEITYQRPALMMQRMASDIAPGHVPVVFRVADDDDALVPMEHSAVEPARDAYTELARRMATFLPPFCATVRKYRYEDLIGLYIVRESLLPVAEGERLIERIDGERAANVTSAEIPPTEAGSRLIPTTWWFTSGEGSTRWCVPRECYSKKICYEPPTGKHEPDVVHRAVWHEHGPDTAT